MQVHNIQGKQHCFKGNNSEKFNPIKVPNNGQEGYVAYTEKGNKYYKRKVEGPLLATVFGLSTIGFLGKYSVRPAFNNLKQTDFKNRNFKGIIKGIGRICALIGTVAFAAFATYAMTKFGRDVGIIIDEKLNNDMAQKADLQAELKNTELVA